MTALLNTVLAELIKLRRSLALAVVVTLPVVLVGSGLVNTLVAGSGLADGWHTLWLRSVVLYGMFPLPVGIALLAALSWRVEHRGGNWPALMSGPTSTLRIATAKVIAVLGLVLMMQAVHVAAFLAVGKLLFRLPGWPPAEYLGVAGLTVLASLPVVVVQSGLAMVLRSFAAPIAVGFVAAGCGLVALLAGGGLGLVLPHALLTRTTQLGTGTFADSGSVTAGDVTTIAVVAVASAAVWLAATVAVVERRDVRTA